MNPTYVQTVNLLLDIAPTVFQTPRFAMKGGVKAQLLANPAVRKAYDAQAPEFELARELIAARPLCHDSCPVS